MRTREQRANRTRIEVIDTHQEVAEACMAKVLFWRNARDVGAIHGTEAIREVLQELETARKIIGGDCGIDEAIAECRTWLAQRDQEAKEARHV